MPSIKKNCEGIIKELSLFEMGFGDGEPGCNCING
jgi:hypothetical protein